LNFSAFPAVLPSAAIVAVIQVPWHANNHDHNLVIRLVDSDGRPAPGFDVQGQFRGSAGPDMKYGDPGLLPVAIPIVGLQIERPSDYSFVLEVDGIELARYSVRVRQVFGAGAGFTPPPGPARPTDW
jgi:hypothetical protein